MTSHELQSYCDKVLKYLYDKDDYQQYNYAGGIFKDLEIDSKYSKEIIESLYRQRPRKIDTKPGLIFPSIKINKNGIDYVEITFESQIRPIMTTEQKRQIIQLCEETINNTHKVRVGWAIEQVLGTEYKIQLHKTIALALSETGKYKYSVDFIRPNDFEVIKDPAYKPQKISDKYPVIWEISKIVLTILISTSATLLLTKSKDRESNREQERLKTDIQKINSRLDSLSKR